MAAFTQIFTDRVENSLQLPTLREWV